MKRLLQRAVLALLIAAGALYLGDFAWLRYRVAASRNPFGQVEVERDYAVRLKDGKTEYMFDPPQKQTCAAAIFPHMGLQPCWYLRRSTRQVVKM